MKKLLFIPLLFVSYIAMAQAKTDYNKPTLNKESLNRLLDPARIIGKPIKIGNLEVAQNDFPYKMNWDKGNEECSKLGDGWRLPAKYELDLLYKNKNKIGNFAYNDFWSATISSNDSYGGTAWYRSFSTGSQSMWGKNGNFFIRAVRSISLKK